MAILVFSSTKWIGMGRRNVVQVICTFAHLYICICTFVHLHICRKSRWMGSVVDNCVALNPGTHPAPINWIESVAGLPLRRKLAQPANRICASVFVFVFVLYCRPDGCSMYGRSQFSMSTLAWSHPSPWYATSICICIGPPRQIFSHTSVNRISDCDQKYFNAGS